MSFWSAADMRSNPRTRGGTSSAGKKRGPSSAAHRKQITRRGRESLAVVKLNMVERLFPPKTPDSVWLGGYHRGRLGRGADFANGVSERSGGNSFILWLACGCQRLAFRWHDPPPMRRRAS